MAALVTKYLEDCGRKPMTTSTHSSRRDWPWLKSISMATATMGVLCAQELQNK